MLNGRLFNAWDRALLHMNSLNVTNEMQLLKIFIIITDLRVSGGAYENCKCSL